MNRRNFLLGIIPALLLGCAANTVTYYAENKQELEIMKRKIAEQKYRIVEVKYDPNSKFYIIKAR